MRIKLLLALACITLAACGGREQEAKTPDGAAAGTPEIAAAPAAPLGTPFKEPLVGGLALPFKYNITSDKSPRTKEGLRARAVGLEFLEGDVPMSDKRLAEAFAAVGYERKLPAVKEGATRSIYTKTGEPDVLVWVRPDAPPGPQFGPMSADAKGTVYLAWKMN